MTDSVAKLQIPTGDQARSYAVLALLLTTGMAAALVGLNVAVNPRAEFPVKGLPPLASDRVHLRVQDYLDRAAPPEGLVIGASRANLVEGLPGREDVTANFGVAGSTAEDWRDLYRFVRARQGAPETLVLVVEQSAFTDVFSPRVPRSSEAGRVLGDPPSAPELAARALRSLSPDYAQDALHSLQLRYITGYPALPTELPDPAFADPGLLADYRAGTFRPAEVDADVERQFVRAFGPEAETVPAHRAALDELLDDAVSDGVDVWIVLPAFQPVAFIDLQERFAAYGTQAAAVRGALTAWCAHVHVADASNATQMDIDPAQFLDQSHLTATGARQMMAGVMAGRGDACPQSV